MDYITQRDAKSGDASAAAVVVVASLEEEKPRLSSLIKMSTTKSRNLVTKKSLPPARHERFDNRKPWRRSQPRLEKRLLVKATLDKSLRVLSRHQSRLLNGEDAQTAAAKEAATFDDVDIGSWTLVRNGDRAMFHETQPEVTTSTTATTTTNSRMGKRSRDCRDSHDNEPIAHNKRFKADWNNNNEKSGTEGDHETKGAKNSNNGDSNNNNSNDDDDDDIIIDVENESEGEQEKQETVTELNWQWLSATANNNNQNGGGFYPPPPPPISPPLPPHLLQPQPQPAASFDYDYYFYCLRFFYHYRRFCAARDMTTTESSNNVSLVS